MKRYNDVKREVIFVIHNYFSIIFNMSEKIIIKRMK